jgi:hypothetical protein
MLYHVDADIRVYPKELKVITFDTSSLVKLYQCKDDPAGFIDELMKHYQVRIPTTALSEFAQGKPSLKEQSLRQALIPLSLEDLSPSFLKTVNERLGYFVKCYSTTESKNKDAKNTHRNDMQIISQAFDIKAALIVEESRFDCFNNVLHIPGAEYAGIEYHTNLTARVPLFTFAELEKSLTEDITYTPKNVQNYNREKFGIEPIDNDQESVVYSMVDIQKNAVQVFSPEDEWAIHKELINDPQKVLVTQVIDGKKFVAIASPKTKKSE